MKSCKFQIRWNWKSIYTIKGWNLILFCLNGIQIKCFRLILSIPVVAPSVELKQRHGEWVWFPGERMNGEKNAFNAMWVALVKIKEEMFMIKCIIKHNNTDSNKLKSSIRSNNWYIVHGYFFDQWIAMSFPVMFDYSINIVLYSYNRDCISWIKYFKAEHNLTN